VKKIRPILDAIGNNIVYEVSAVEISSQEKIPLPVFFAAMQTYQVALAEGLGNEKKGAMIKV
jgi:3-hydroxyisobutyrate dehydrogenase-like beta-hydroxyacid dehydrogenase